MSGSPGAGSDRGLAGAPRRRPGVRTVCGHVYRLRAITSRQKRSKPTMIAFWVSQAMMAIEQRDRILIGRGRLDLDGVER